MSKVSEQAREKLTKEVESNKHLKVFADYLLARIEEDEVLCNGIMQKNNSLKGCLEDVKAKAKKKASSGMAMVEDATVFKWVEQYFGKKNAKVTKEGLEAAKKSVKNGSPTKFDDKKRNGKGELEGQMDMFGMMGGGM